MFRLLVIASLLTLLTSCRERRVDVDLVDLLGGPGPTGAEAQLSSHTAIWAPGKPARFALDPEDTHLTASAWAERLLASTQRCKFEAVKGKTIVVPTIQFEKPSERPPSVGLIVLGTERKFTIAMRSSKGVDWSEDVEHKPVTDEVATDHGCTEFRTSLPDLAEQAVRLVKQHRLSTPTPVSVVFEMDADNHRDPGPIAAVRALHAAKLPDGRQAFVVKRAFAAGEDGADEFLDLISPPGPFAPAVTGGLCRDDLFGGLLRAHAPLDVCYAVALRKNKTLAGKTVVRFDVRENGTTANASHTESTLDDKDAAA